jgi:DMSO/TMAO reductase YedYZ molybdopterin-dependent catalytic subunit
VSRKSEPIVGQHLVMSLGPKVLACWTVGELEALPRAAVGGDFREITYRSHHFETWEGVTFDNLLRDAEVDAITDWVLVRTYNEFSMSVPTRALRNCKGLLATRWNGFLLDPRHDGPVRILLSSLGGWKTAA